MAITKTTFLAKDGKEFNTAVEADAHDLLKSIEHRIDDYATSVGLGKAQTTTAKKLISGYVAHVKNNFAVDPTDASLAEKVVPVGSVANGVADGQSQDDLAHESSGA